MSNNDSLNVGDTARLEKNELEWFWTYRMVGWLDVSISERRNKEDHVQTWIDSLDCGNIHKDKEI